MARLATTFDAFNAVAEPSRREILGLLAGGERCVGDVVEALDMRQPQASKHLLVLLEVGLVSVRVVGRQRLYRINGKQLKPIHDWVSGFERLWHERLDRLGDYLNELQSKGAPHGRRTRSRTR